MGTRIKIGDDIWVDIRRKAEGSRQLRIAIQCPKDIHIGVTDDFVESETTQPTQQDAEIDDDRVSVSESQGVMVGDGNEIREISRSLD